MDKINLTPVELNNQLKSIDPQKLLDSIPHVHYDFQPNPVPKIENSMLKEQKKFAKEVIELQNQLEDSQVQLKRANDQISSQTLIIKQLKTDLKEESEKASKISTKDLILLLLGAILGAVSPELISFLSTRLPL